jgi:hypothetical protein
MLELVTENAARQGAAQSRHADVWFSRVNPHRCRVHNYAAREATCETLAWGQMALGWTAAAVLEAIKGFRRLTGHKDMAKRVAALRTREQQPGIVVSMEDVA